jgi:hypothetical protein
MARKNTLNYTLATGQTLASSFVTPATVVQNLDSCSYQINISTTDSVGTFAVQVSNDFQQDEVNNVIKTTGTWTALTLSGIPTVSASSDSIVIDLQQLPFYAMRLSYTSTTAGTGTCSVILNCKQLGG